MSPDNALVRRDIAGHIGTVLRHAREAAALNLDRASSAAIRRELAKAAVVLAKLGVSHRDIGGAS